MKQLHLGDLVLTPDDYYAIAIGAYPGRSDVFACNGLRLEYENHKLRPLPLSARKGAGGSANFAEILRNWTTTKPNEIANLMARLSTNNPEAAHVALKAQIACVLCDLMTTHGIPHDATTAEVLEDIARNIRQNHTQ